MGSDRPLVFHVCNPCGKIFLWYQGQGYLFGSNSTVTFSHKAETMVITFEW